MQSSDGDLRPYQLESYNVETGEVVLFKANTRYVGNYAGQRPLIETVVLRETTNAQALQNWRMVRWTS